MDCKNKGCIKHCDVRLVRTHPEAVLPARGTPGSAGWDLSSVENVTLEPGQRRLIQTGFNIALPVGWEGQVRPRSGLAKKYGVTVLNTPGTVDEDYTGPLGVVLHNASNWPFEVTVGMRIAQIVFMPTYSASVREIDHFTDEDVTVRGSEGFGSTGL